MQKTNISTTQQMPTPQALNLNSQESANTISSISSINNSKILIIKVAPNTYLFKYNE
jgi:hypothetical protein